MSLNQTTVCDSCGAEHHAEVPAQPILGALLDGGGGRHPIGWSRVALSGSRMIDPKKIEKSPEEEALDEMLKLVSKEELPKGIRKFFKSLKQMMRRVSSMGHSDHEHFSDNWDLCSACTEKLRAFLKTMDLKQEMLSPRTLAAMAGMGGAVDGGPMSPPVSGRTLDDLLGGDEQPDSEAGDAG